MANGTWSRNSRFGVEGPNQSGVSPMRDDLLARIRLHRQGDRSPLILCEGSPDRVVLRKLVNLNPEIFPAGSRAQVIRLVVEVNDDRRLGPAVAVVDRDFDDSVALAQAGGLPVIAYSGADLESMLWESEVLDRAAEMLCTASKVADAGGLAAVRVLLDSVIEPLQRLRVASLRHSLGLDFDQIDLRKRISATDLSLNVGGLCDSLRRDRPEVARRWLIEQASQHELPVCPATGQPLFRGKDRIAVFGAALKRKLGQMTHQEVHHENIARIFYTAAARDAVGEPEWLSELEARLV